MILQRNIRNSRNFLNARNYIFSNTYRMAVFRNLFNVYKDDLPTVHFNDPKAKNTLAEKSTEFTDIS